MTLTANGHRLRTDPEHFGELVDSIALVDDPDALRSRFNADGYVFLRGFLPADVVLRARREILTKYAIIGEVDDRLPVTEGVAGDGHAVLETNMRAFTESVRTGHHYEAVILHDGLLSMVGHLLDAEATPFDFRWPRLVRPGEGCGFHCDGPYMSRGTDRHLSTWIPLGAVTPANSGLIVLEASHTNQDLLDGYLSKDADRDGLVWLDEDPSLVQQRYGKRWLTTDYEPGDVLAFTMNTLHGALDNTSADRCRLSTDSRYYAAGEHPDPRWNGDNINPHGPGRVFYPGLGRWANADFQDEWKYVDERGRLVLAPRTGDDGAEANQ
jgi:ectoine hydroxylase-related dioxygenase (phytanoyl-CoA dioxygenase family)